MGIKNSNNDKQKQFQCQFSLQLFFEDRLEKNVSLYFLTTKSAMERCYHEWIPFCLYLAHERASFRAGNAVHILVTSFCHSADWQLVPVTRKEAKQRQWRRRLVNQQSVRKVQQNMFVRPQEYTQHTSEGNMETPHGTFKFFFFLPLNSLRYRAHIGMLCWVSEVLSEF